MANAWDIKADETAEEYQAFLLYFDMGLNRSQKKVARALGRNSVQYMATKNRWDERVKASLEQSRIGINPDELNPVLLTMQNQEQIIADTLKDYEELLAQWRISFIRARVDELDPLTPKDISQYVQARISIAEMGRKAVGLPTNINNNHETVEKKLPENRVLNLPSGIVYEEDNE